MQGHIPAILTFKWFCSFSEEQFKNIFPISYNANNLSCSGGHLGCTIVKKKKNH